MTKYVKRPPGNGTRGARTARRPAATGSAPPARTPRIAFPTAANVATSSAKRSAPPMRTASRIAPAATASALAAKVPNPVRLIAACAAMESAKRSYARWMRAAPRTVAAEMASAIQSSTKRTRRVHKIATAGTWSVTGQATNQEHAKRTAATVTTSATVCVQAARRIARPIVRRVWASRAIPRSSYRPRFASASARAATASAISLPAKRTWRNVRRTAASSIR